MKLQRISLLLLAAASLNACSEDVTTATKPEQPAPEDPGKIDPEDPTPTEPAPDKPACKNECVENETTCDGTQIRNCEKTDDGCFVWGISHSCGMDMICDQASSSCIEGCVDECKDGEMKCDGTLVQICQKSEHTSCLVWSMAESCGNDLRCENDTCVSGCIDECKEGETVCEQGMVRTCGNYDEDSCLDLSEPTDCGTDSVCDDKTNQCVAAGCDNQCTPGDKICSTGQDAILECKIVGENGCYEYTVSETCGQDAACADASGTPVCEKVYTKICQAGQKKCSDSGKSILTCEENSTTNAWKETACTGSDICDPASNSCKSTCQNVCTEGATQCSSSNAAVVQTCKKDANGCTQWVNEEPCQTAMTCSAGKCAYSCGAADSEDCKPFSLVILPDTQNYTRYSTKQKTTYHDQMNWIVKYQNTSTIPNLKMVVHMGDITENNWDVQWEIAKDAHQILVDKKIPFTVVTGNHDYRVQNGSTYVNGSRGKSKFKDYFSKSYLEKLPGYLGMYDDVNTYFTFHAGGQDFLILNLEYAPRQQTLCWANDLLQKAQFKNHKVIVVTHAYLSHTFQTTKDGKAVRADKPSYCGKANIKMVPNGSSGSEMWSGLIARHSNIVMVLSGHVGDTEYRIDKGYNNNYVPQVLTDYQFEKPCSEATGKSCSSHCGHVPGAGNGWLRVMTFDPKTNKVSVNTHTAIPSSTTNFSKEKNNQFYCSQLNAKATDTAKQLLAGVSGEKYSDNDAWYAQSLKDKEHNYEFSVDFTTKKQNVYKTNSSLEFGHRGINYNGNGDQRNPSIASNDTGRMIIVWEDDSSSTDNKQHDGKTNAHDIYGRIMIPGGCNLANNAEIVINSNTEGHQADPDVAMDEAGNFVVVWTDDTDNNGYYEIMMRGFNADGTERFKQKLVNTVSAGNQTHARIAMAPDGQFAVSWTDEQSSAATPQISVRGFKANGTEAFPAKYVADKVEGTRVNSDIFMDQNHNIYVAWEDDADGNGATQATMRILNADGSYKTNVQNVNSKADGNQDTPSISGKQDGSKIIVAWLNKVSNKTTIMARTFDGNGKQIDADTLLSHTDGTLSDPQVCMNNNGTSLITWYNASTRNIQKRKFGTTSEKDSIVNSPDNTSTSATYAYTTGKSMEPAIACIPKGNAAYITFSDDNDGNGYFEIYAVGKNI